MQVNQWGANSEGTHAHGVLFYRKAESDGPFDELTSWPVDALFVNTAPVAAELPDGSPAVFMATTALYRHSPVYLAYVAPSQIGDAAAYHYLTGYDENGSPIWTTQMVNAKPLPGLENVWAGELSLRVDARLNSYLLMFKDYATDTFTLYTSSTPYGPFWGPLAFFPCGTTSSRPAWMESGWGMCYGGFMLPGFFGTDGSLLFFVVSLWDPYTTVLMTMRLSTLSTTGSTSQITSTSTPVQSSTNAEAISSNSVVTSSITSTLPIPGFQAESIAAGIALGLAALVLLRRRRR
jgi:hypothetical protein